MVVFAKGQWQPIEKQRKVIDRGEALLFLVVEVVSESTVSTDYRSKKTEYAVLDILGCWIVDPLKQRVTVCYLVDGDYDEAVFQGDESIVSRIFPELVLSVVKVFAG
jgi:Uma2 family endonuclease